MNIALLAEYVLHSGVGMYIDTMCSRLCERGHNVHIIADKYVYSDNVDRFCRLNMSDISVDNIIVNIKFLRKFFKKNKIEVVELNHRRCGFLMKIYNTIYWYDRMPCIWILHTQQIPSSMIYRMGTYAGDKTIAISAEVEECLINKLKISKKKVVRILNGVDESKLDILSPQERQKLKGGGYGFSDNCIVICMHGRIDKVKGIDVLIQALALLDQAHLDKIRVICSGSTENNAYYEELLKLIDQYNLREYIRFIGWTSPREILGVSDLFVLPSRREGCALSVIEAFFMKVPVIRTRTGGYIDTADVCDSVDINDAQGLSEKLREFIDNIHKYDDMVESAYSFVKQNCTLDIMVDRTLLVFEEVIK